jgi:reactive chlorine resistance protein C
MGAMMTDAALAARQASSATQRRDESDSISRAGETITAIGGGILRYGLVAILLYLGAFKFTLTEAEAIRPLLELSPLMSWLYLFTGVQGASNLIGTAEIVTAILLAVRPWSPRLTVIGSILGILTFLATLSFLVTTPGTFERVPDFPIPVANIVGWFLIKDLFLLGASVWSLGESLQASRSR